jgi:uncharacterized protein YidB (DUF937 family)
MGLLDSIGGQVLGALQGQGGAQHGGLMDVVMGMVNNPQTGGLSGLIDKFKEGGLGEVAASWVSTGQNMPISGDQIASVLGNGQLQEIAQKLGLDTSAVSGQLAQMLPQVVDKLTPHGEVPDGDALGNLMGMLRGMKG